LSQVTDPLLTGTIFSFISLKLLSQLFNLFIFCVAHYILRLELNFNNLSEKVQLL
jgi:hypothetical protein